MKNIFENKVAHGIVGWNYVDYLSNAIDSIICYRISDEPLFVIITGGKSEDFDLIVDKYKHTTKVYISEIHHDSQYASKTGSLYHGYNQLFAQVKNNGFQYLNLIQSDIQLLWWDQEIIAHYIMIFENFKNSIQVYTGFPKRGTNPGVYKTDLRDYKILQGNVVIHFQVGLSDWGFFDLDRWSARDLSWSGTEESMSADAHKKGIVSPLSRIPCAADIPWPAVIRGGCEIGTPIKRTEMLLVKGAYEDALIKLKATKTGALWAEDWVKSWGWWALEPTWNTEFTFVYPIRVIKSIFIYKNFKYAWSSYGEHDRLFPPWGRVFRPHGAAWIKMIKGVLSIILHKIYRKLI